jgi:hypothetical protein
MLLVGCLAWGATQVSAQTTGAPERKFKEATTRLWLNTYGNVRVSDRLFWIAQTHFRFQEKDQTKFAGQVAQIYNRHALS